MKNQVKGFSPEPDAPTTETEEVVLRNEFEIMQRLDFVFIKELGVNNAEEYIMEIKSLRYSMKDANRGPKAI